MKKILLLSFLCCYVSIAYATAHYTNVTATLVDATTQPWAGAIVTAQIQPPFGNPNPIMNGGISPITPVIAIADATGTFGIILDDNLTITPTGSTWKFTLCPNATVTSCSVTYATITGATQDISAALSNALTQIQVTPAPFSNRAYGDTEMVSPGQGALYWRVTDNHLRGFDGVQWIDIVGTSGNIPTAWDAIQPPLGNTNITMGNFPTIMQYGNATGNQAMWSFADGSVNTGTGPLVMIRTGNGSTAPPLGVCTKGTANCVMMNNLAMFEAIGSAQIVATSLFNNGPGVGTIFLGSNGTGAVSGTNQVALTGNNNKLYVSQNASPLAKLPNIIYKNGAQIVHTGTTTSDNVYTIPFPAQLADGSWRFTVALFSNSQAPATTSTLEFKVNGTQIATITVNNNFVGNYENITLTCMNTTSVSAQRCIMQQISSLGTLDGIFAFGTSANTGAATTFTVVMTDNANADSQTFQNVLLEEL